MSTRQPTDLRNHIFELQQNEDGHACEATTMTFDGSIHPFRATYCGPNVDFGHAIVENDVMLYHARDNSGNLSAGRARIELQGSTMTLTWQWLTGDKSNGVSSWRQVEA